MAALIAGTLLSLLWLQGVPVIGEVPTGLPKLRSPDLSLNILARGLEPALIIGFLAAIDGLLSSLIADSMTRTRHNPNRVLVGQGLGNVVAGLIGGLPGAGSTTRTVVKRLIDAAIDQKTECIVMGLSGLPAVTLGALNVLQRVPPDRIVGKLSKAREIAQKILDD